MMHSIPLFVAFVWFGLAFWLRTAKDFQSARRTSAWVLAASVVICGAAWFLGDELRPITLVGRSSAASTFSVGGFRGLEPVMISIVGWVAVALSDALSHSLSTLRRILVLVGLALLFVIAEDARILAIIWLLSPLVAWSELRARYGARSVARLFALYHAPSVLLFLAAVLLEESGWVVYSAMAGIAAIGIREAVVPGHSWFPRFVEESPMGLVVAFIAPQLGVYAHVQLLADGLPETMAQTVAIFGAFTALCAAALGVVQTSPRRALAYLMMSQTGLVAFGIESPSEVAFAGSLLTWQVLAVATSSFAMTVSALEARRGLLSLAEYSGCFSRTPRMAAGFLVMGLASVGFPMTLGFIAEDLLVQGSVEATPVLAFVLIGATALNGMNVMRAFFRLFSGRRVHGGEQDLTRRESWALSVVLIVLLLGGTAPTLITSRAFEFVPKHRAGPHAEATSARPGEPRDSLPSAPLRAFHSRS